MRDEERLGGARFFVMKLVDCRKVTITSCYASNLVWRLTAKFLLPVTSVRN
jgi:hypothetical protein